MPRSPAASALALLRRSDFRAFLAAVILAGTADSALAILLGVTVYHITRDPLALGWLGLIEAAPAIGLVLVGGHVADPMALGLFAVFFGGMMGLLPMFGAHLGVGAEGAGLMRAALSAGGPAAMTVAIRHPSRERAGLALLLAVAGVGVSVLGFGLSTEFHLSLALLFVMGACDGISVVVRHAIVRLAALKRMRGRTAAVRMVFLDSANELGGFESGVAAYLVGPALAVAGGGAITLAVVAVTAAIAPKLRRLTLLELKPRE